MRKQKTIIDLTLSGNGKHDDTKQDKILDLDTIRSGAEKGATSIQPNDNISKLTNDADYITADYHDTTKQDVLTAGTNIQIANNTISATDTTYTGSGDITVNDNVISFNNTTGYVTSDYHDDTKQDVISDIETIRTNASTGAGLSDQVSTNTSNISTLTDRPYIKTIKSGAAGYQIWSNGYCEQWGAKKTATSSTTYTINLTKTYADNSYTPLITCLAQGTIAWIDTTPTASSFAFYVSTNAGGAVYWRTFGYLAEGQY